MATETDLLYLVVLIVLTLIVHLILTTKDHGHRGGRAR
jgi:hypothetical protein